MFWRKKSKPKLLSSCRFCDRDDCYRNGTIKHYEGGLVTFTYDNFYPNKTSVWWEKAYWGSTGAWNPCACKHWNPTIDLYVAAKDFDPYASL